jgi:hypothetical protein
MTCIQTGTPMTAPHNLGMQFANVEQLKSMQANDFASDQYGSVGLSKYHAIGQPMNISVGELHKDLPAYHPAVHTYDWGRLKEDVAQHGMHEPLHIQHLPGEEHPRLVNGHHRALEAISQGHMFVPVTENPDPSTAGGDYRTVVPKAPTRTWEPLIQEHELAGDRNRYETAMKTHQARPFENQGKLFDNKFNDRRSKA